MFGAVEGLLIFLCGSREYDELTLAEMLSTLAKVITTLCRQGSKGQRATEAVGAHIAARRHVMLEPLIIVLLYIVVRGWLDVGRVVNFGQQYGTIRAVACLFNESGCITSTVDHAVRHEQHAPLIHTVVFKGLTLTCRQHLHATSCRLPH